MEKYKGKTIRICDFASCLLDQPISTTAKSIPIFAILVQWYPYEQTMKSDMHEATEMHFACFAETSKGTEL